MKTCLYCDRRCLRMLCVWIFLFLTSGTIAQSGKEDDYRCIIPASDVVKHGNFSVDRWFGTTWKRKDPPPAGTKLLTYELEFQCDPGFFLRGNPYVRCVPLEMEEFPECSDTCESSDPDCPQSDGLSSNLDRLTGSDECGIVSNAPTSLAGGRIAVPGDVPWQAAIYDKTTDPFMQICGGSIVSKDVVISAAHCFKLPDELYAVAVGKIYRPYNNPLDIGAQKSEVLEIRIPSRYRGSETSFQDDIAAVILATPIRFSSMIHPVCLHFGADFDEVQLTPGKLGRVAGWGIDSQNGRASQVLNLAEMPMVDIGTCFMLQDVSFIQYITSDKICAGYTNGTTLCKGDSGGGLAVPHKSGYTTKYYLRGIVSTGPPPATLNECNINAVTTFTRVARHEYFVKSAMTKKPQQESERRVPPIIPANFINSNPNILGNNGVIEGVPLKVDPVQPISIFRNERPVFGNSRDLQVGVPGTVVVIPDTLTIDGDRNTQEPLIDDLFQTNDFMNERPTIGNNHDPQADAPGTVVVIPNTHTTDRDRNTQDSLTDDRVQTNNFMNERPIIGNFGNSRDPQADAPGTVVVIPDTLPIDGDRNTQDPLTDDRIQTNDFMNERPIIGNFGNSRDPQADAPGTVVVIPDTLPTDGDRNTQDPLADEHVQTNNFKNEMPIIGNLDNNREMPIIGNIGNSRDPQADAPGTVVVIPDTLPRDKDRNTQDLLTDDRIQTNNFMNERPIIGNFGKSRDPQADAPGTVVIIPNTLTRININTEDPLKEDSVQPVGIGSINDPNVTPVTVADNPETFINIGHKNDERTLKNSFIPKPIAELDDNDKAPLDITRKPTVTSMKNIEIISEILPTTPSTQLHHGAPDYLNYQHWPYLPHRPYQQTPNQNWHYPSPNVHYPSPNVHYPSLDVQYPSQNVQIPSQNVQYPSQNVQYPSQNKYQNAQNVDINGHFGHDGRYNNPVWNIQNHPGYHQGQWWRK